MPSATFYRVYGITAPPDDPQSTTGGGVSVPDGAVLFGYNKRYENDDYLKATTTSYGKLSSFYRRGIEFISASTQRFLKNTPLNTNWNFTDQIAAANSVFANKQANGLSVYANFLDGHIGQTNYAEDWDNYRLSGRHGYLSPHPLGSEDLNYPGRIAADVPIILGFNTGDTVGTEKYTVHNKAHEGHYHKVLGVDIDFSLANIAFGKDLSTPALTKFTTGGLHLLPIIPIVQDRRLGGSKTKPLTTLPKGILVFGEDLSLDNDISIWTRDQYNPEELPTGDYTSHDYDHEQFKTTKGDSASSDTSDMNDNYNTYSTVPLYLTTTSTDTGVLVPAQTTFSISAVSNVSGLHTHASTTTAFKSNKTGQTGSTLGPSGAHNHVVEYTGNLYVKSKWLNGWVTLKDETPLANGMIIAFSPQFLASQASSYITKTDLDLLPPYWHFCNGSNGTPDLRDYHVAVNMYESQAGLHNTEVSDINKVVFTSINVGASTGEVNVLYTSGDGGFVNSPKKTHTHVTGSETGTGSPMKMTGSHGVDPERWHIHQPLTAANFSEAAIIGTTATQVTYNNIRANISYSYNPPRQHIAFIMLNKAIL
jgi:hypothetical protein